MDNDQWRLMHDLGLAFFGRIAAGVSHELKNHLAVINEQSGLMSDLLLIGQGKNPAVLRLTRLSRDIAEQVRKADQTLGTFSRFSHTVDRQYRTVDLNELAEIMVAVTGRMASAKGVSLVRGSATPPVMIVTSPFLLEQLVFLCLEHILSQADQGGDLTLGVSGSDNRAALDLSYPHALAPLPDSECSRLLRDILHAEVHHLRDGSMLRIDLPLVIQGHHLPSEQGTG
jgi:signal transduction histidine kinase